MSHAVKREGGWGRLHCHEAAIPRITRKGAIKWKSHGIMASPPGDWPAWALSSVPQVAVLYSVTKCK